MFSIWSWVMSASSNRFSGSKGTTTDWGDSGRETVVMFRGGGSRWLGSCWRTFSLTVLPTLVARDEGRRGFDSCWRIRSRRRVLAALIYAMFWS